MGCETCVLGTAACHRACEVLFNVILVVPEQVCISFLLYNCLWVIFISFEGLSRGFSGEQTSGCSILC